jgi:hypothetical protein
MAGGKSIAVLQKVQGNEVLGLLQLQFLPERYHELHRPF